MSRFNRRDRYNSDYDYDDYPPRNYRNNRYNNQDRYSQSQYNNQKGRFSKLADTINTLGQSTNNFSPLKVLGFGLFIVIGILAVMIIFRLLVDFLLDFKGWFILGAIAFLAFKIFSKRKAFDTMGYEEPELEKPIEPQPATETQKQPTESAEQKENPSILEEYEKTYNSQPTQNPQTQPIQQTELPQMTRSSAFGNSNMDDINVNQIIEVTAFQSIDSLENDEIDKKEPLKIIKSNSLGQTEIKELHKKSSIFDK